METKIINIFAGPGAGKSMFCMELLAELKKLGCVKGFTAEYVSEAAKEYVWTDSPLMDGSEKHQLILLGEQLHKLERLNGNVNYVITDSPLLLNALYNKQCNCAFEKMVTRLMGTYSNYNLFLNRDLSKPYESAGRLQTLDEAIKKDKELRRALCRNYIRFKDIDYRPKEVAKLIVRNS